ncbi:MAG: hypothetical protein ACLFU6_07320 [Candidatus Hydrogenedentota bacterium]
MNKLWINLTRWAYAVLGGATLLLLPACGPENPSEAPTEGKEQMAAPVEQDEETVEAEKEAEGGSVEARHGGVLAELGDGEAYVEFVLDPEAGWVSMYILNSSARDRVRLTAEQIGVIFTMHGDDIPAEERTFSLALQPVESALTGETVGDAAHFEARHERFQNAEGFDAVIPTLRVKDTEYSNVGILYPSDRD